MKRLHIHIGVENLDHLGLQMDEDSELEELRSRLKQAAMAVYGEGETICCYARSDKSWVKDPSDIPWEAYRSMEDVGLFNAAEKSSTPAYCAPTINR
jgi:hypothetical protein